MNLEKQKCPLIYLKCYHEVFAHKFSGNETIVFIIVIWSLPIQCLPAHVGLLFM